MPQAAGAAVVGWITGGAAASAAVATTAAIAGAAASAAVTGAIIGAGMSVVSGGNILDGALKGAAYGAVTGGVLEGIGQLSAGTMGGSASGASNLAGTTDNMGQVANEAINPGTAGMNISPEVYNQSVAPVGTASVASATSANIPPATPQPSNQGLLSKYLGDDKGEILGGTMQGLAQGGIGYLSAGAEADAAKEQMAEEQKYTEINRAATAPATFQAQTARITPPDWWTSQLEKRGLLV